MCNDSSNTGIHSILFFVTNMEILMTVHYRVFFFLAIGVLASPTALFGQAGAGGGGHIHDLHPTTLHGGYKRVSLGGPGNSTPVVKLDSSNFETIFSEWLVNNSCNDSVERGNNYSREVTHKVHVTLTGSYEWGAEAGATVLAAEVKATTKAKVELQGGWEGSWKESLSFSSKINLSKCQKIFYYFGKTKNVGSGTVTTWEHKIVCACQQHTNCNYRVTKYCDKRTLSGSGVGWGAHYGEHVQRGLVDPCPCDDIDDDTRPVLEPQVPGVIVADPAEVESDETNGDVPDPPTGTSVLENGGG